MRKVFAGLALLLGLMASANAENWSETEAKARGQTVYWNAWAGDPKINTYIDWVTEQVEDRYGVKLKHVKVKDTAEAVTRVLAEKQAGRDTGGSVDLVWINGENFAAMKQNGLLYGPFVDSLPNFALVDTKGKPTTLVDFTVPVDGLEAPWGMAQFVFIYDTARVQNPLRTLQALLEWAKANPGRFTYPQPPDFIGSTFLKQALVQLVTDPQRLQKPVDNADFAQVSAPLWSYLDQLHPVQWRKGQVFPHTGPNLKQLLADSEVDMALSFYPGEASRDIASGLLPETVRTFVLDGGTIGNTHFIAIPYNSNAKEGAMVVANFLMSPEAQARKQDPQYWGDDTVLDMKRLSAEDRARFAALNLGIATLPPEQLGMPLPEPHPSWMTRLEEEWSRRYGAGKMTAGQ